MIARFLSRRLALCLLCHGPAGNEAGICRACAAELPVLGSACPRCALPLPTAAACPGCLRRPPAIGAARCAWHYAYPVAQLIRRFKHDGDLAAGHSLGLLAARQLRPVEPLPDLLVPVPLHWRRRWQRGFNQAELVAEALGRAWQLPVGRRVMCRIRAGASQQALDRRQRLANLRDSFSVRGKVQGLRIGLVDDVITTGATLDAAAAALLDSGALSISAYALARTP
ncbi:ComF family protein [Microbulbifer yueqingensis]|uniref:ComF family protein n=1 Tax=Microbulbifer yueqingensis TaxID=658219 RepID=UPI001FDF5BDA|nr:ComF family protein [Microbulbifer yueqingensis]